MHPPSSLLSSQLFCARTQLQHDTPILWRRRRVGFLVHLNNYFSLIQGQWEPCADSELEQGGGAGAGRSGQAGHQATQTLIFYILLKNFLGSEIGFSLYPAIFYIIRQWSCSVSGSLWEMPDSNPEPLPQKSGALSIFWVFLPVRFDPLSITLEYLRIPWGR